MNRFQRLSSFHALVFPARPQQLDFLERARPAAAPGRWVDVACGSGQQLEGLADRGLEVWGLDLEAEMVGQIAARRPDLATRVVAGDMRDLDRLLGPLLPGPAGAIYCIGNSLVQLVAPQDLMRALEAARRLLAPGGAMVVQIVNFDRVLSGDFDLLPRIEKPLPGGGSCVLERKYEPTEDPERVRFVTRLTSPEGVEDQAHEIRALKKDELGSLLEAAGFGEMEWFGDYQPREWRPDSPATIVRALARVV